MKLNTRPSTGLISVTINTDHGERTVSTGTSNPKLARRIIKAANVESVEVMAKAGTLTQSLIHKLTIGGRKTVSDVIDEWEVWLRSTCGSDRTAQNHSYYVKEWAREAKLLSKRIADIKEHHISDWLNIPDGTKLGSKRVKLSAIRSLFQYSSIREYSTDPSRLARIKTSILGHEDKEPKVKECFTEDEFRRLIGHLEKRMTDSKHADDRSLSQKTLRFWYCASIIGRYSALRLGDICCLEWACFSKPGFMVVWTEKRDARVELPIDDRLFKGVSAIPINKSKLCFPEQNQIYRSNRSTLSVQFSRLLSECGVDGHSFHDLRHTLLSEMVRDGKSLSDAAKVAGHASTKTTEGYIH